MGKSKNNIQLRSYSSRMFDCSLNIRAWFVKHKLKAFSQDSDVNKVSEIRSTSESSAAVDFTVSP